MGQASTIGLDIAKRVFQAHGADATGRVVFRKRLVRAKVLEFFAGQPPCLVALEACGGAHYWAWTSPLGLEGLLTNPGTPGGKDGGEANPTELHEGVQGAGGEAAGGRRQGAVGGGDGAWHWHRAAKPMAHRAPGGRLGRGTGRPQGGAGGNAATEARGEAARRGGG